MIEKGTCFINWSSHFMKNHSHTRGNPLPPSYVLLILISNKEYFICTVQKAGYYIPQNLLHHWLEQGIPQWVHHDGSVHWFITLSHYEQTLYNSYITLMTTHHYKYLIVSQNKYVCFDSYSTVVWLMTLKHGLYTCHILTVFRTNIRIVIIFISK